MLSEVGSATDPVEEDLMIHQWPMAWARFIFIAHSTFWVWRVKEPEDSSSHISICNIAWKTHKRSLSKSTDYWSECRLYKNSQNTPGCCPGISSAMTCGKKKFKWENIITAVERREWGRISLLFLTLWSALVWSGCLWSVSSRNWSYLTLSKS